MIGGSAAALDRGDDSRVGVRIFGFSFSQSELLRMSLIAGIRYYCLTICVQFEIEAVRFPSAWPEVNQE